jgi:response regulator of citrate/malate metabolism
VVDDERLYRKSALQLINRESYGRYLEVPTASTAEETRSSVNDFKPGLILLDVDLGSHEISGLELLKQHRNQLPAFQPLQRSTARITPHTRR